MSRVAVIGLGTMGAPMASNLLKAGLEVTVHNRTRSREEALVAEGARPAESPKAAAQNQDIVLVCVSDTPDVEHVLLNGASGVIAGLGKGALVIDCSTISPSATVTMAAQFAAAGIGYVDAPVSGGSEGAVQGTLAVMCGGSENDFQRALPILEIVGASVTRVGDVGAGQVAKAVNQVVISGTYLAVAEGITLAKKAGVDPRRVVQAIQGGAAASWVMDNRSSNMIEDNYPLGFRMRLHRKDLAIALQTARECGAMLAVASLMAAMEDGLVAQGYGDEDMSAVARGVRANAGLKQGPL